MGSPEVIKGQSSIGVIIFFRKRAIMSGTVIARRTPMIPVSERVGRRLARAARRAGTRAPCGSRHSSHAHVLCFTRDETGRGPVSLR